jgi:hypothetical protein
MDFTAAGNKSQHNAVRDPGTGFSRILSDHHAGVWITANQVMAERPADEVGAFHGQRKLAGYTANTIGPE